ncbi:MAG: GtrA family protein [Deltaproteobacteria bacterium]|nr:MAG: GtrA family protein [Deltaproteobacteria bacterium]
MSNPSMTSQDKPLASSNSTEPSATENAEQATSSTQEANLQERLHNKLQSWGLPTWMIQLILFGLIGASGIVVDLAVVVFCREAFGLDVRWGMFPAFIVAVTWNYELNRRITFDSRNVNWWYAYITFFLACTLGLAVRFLWVDFAVDTLGLGDNFLVIGSWKVPYLRLSYIAYVGGIVIAYVVNFLGSKFVAFRQPNKTQE